MKPVARRRPHARSGCPFSLGAALAISRGRHHRLRRQQPRHPLRRPGPLRPAMTRRLCALSTAWRCRRAQAPGTRVTPVERAVRAAIERRGPIPFDEVVDLALTTPTAASTPPAGGPGAAATSSPAPRSGPCSARSWPGRSTPGGTRPGEPDVWTVVEAGAGPGTLARTVLAADPACAPALRYVLVERRRPAGRTRAPALERAGLGFAGARPDDEDAPPASVDGPIVVSLGDLPRVPGPCVVLANELLDNLPFGLLERTADGLGRGARRRRRRRPRRGPRARADRPGRRRRRSGPGCPARTRPRRGCSDAVGARRRRRSRRGLRLRRRPPPTLAAPAVAGVGAHLPAARARRPPARGTSARRTSPARSPSTSCRRPARDRTQADWLRAHGIDELVEEGRRTWQRAGRHRRPGGDAGAQPGHRGGGPPRPAGLGAFRVLEWDGSLTYSGNMPRRGSSV